MSKRSIHRLRVALLAGAAALAAGCSGGGSETLTTPTVSTTASTPRSSGEGSGAKVQVLHRAFEAGGGSGLVASKRYPGVFWAIRDRGAQDRPDKPQNALYAFKLADGQIDEVVPGATVQAIKLPVASRDWEDIGRDDQGNLWIADIGNNECDRGDTALLKVREPDPAAVGQVQMLAVYRYQFPDPPPGCAGRNAEALFLLDNVPYLIDKADQSTVYRFPRLDPQGTTTLEKVGTLAGGVANLSGADLSDDKRLLAVDTHTELFVYAARDTSLRGEALVADLIRHPPKWTLRLDGQTNVEGVAFSNGSQDLNLLAENRNVYLVPAGAYQR